MAFSDWFDVDTWRHASHHFSGSIPVLFSVFIIGFLVNWLFPDGWFKETVLIIDKVAGIAVLVILFFKMLQQLLSGSDGKGHHVFVSA